MKKIIIIGLILIMIMSIPMGVFAAEEDTTVLEYNDSLKISDEERQQLNVKESENVIRIYNLSIHMAFSEINSIDELFEKELVLSEYYAIHTADNTLNYKGIVGSKVENLSDVIINPKALKALQDSRITTKLSSDIEIYETYYFSGETSYTGSAIYYKTNKGDYVYYNHYAFGNSEYLFPAKDFCEYQKAICNEISKSADLDGGVDISKIWDLSKYDINSEGLGMEENMQFADIAGQTDQTQNIVKWGTIFAVIIIIVTLSGMGFRFYKRKA